MNDVGDEREKAKMSKGRGSGCRIRIRDPSVVKLKCRI